MLTARDTVNALLTAYLVSVLTLGWLAVAGGLLWMVGAVWGPMLIAALSWLQVWGPMLAVSILAATAVWFLVVVLVQWGRLMLTPVLLVSAAAHAPTEMPAWLALWPVGVWG